MQTYQEYLYFLERYRHTVFNLIAESLTDYVDYPANRQEEKRILVDGRLKIKEGPYKEFNYHVFKLNDANPTPTCLKIGPKQYNNLVALIRNTVDIKFPSTIEKYASKDCDSKFCKDCAEELIYKLQKIWRLT